MNYSLLLLPIFLSSAFSGESQRDHTFYLKRDYMISSKIQIEIPIEENPAPFPRLPSMRLLPFVNSQDLDGDGKKECFVYTYTPIESGLGIKLEGIPYGKEKNLLDLARNGEFLILGSESGKLQISNLLEPQFR